MRALEKAIGLILVVLGCAWSFFFVALAVVAPVVSNDIWEWHVAMVPLAISVAVLAVGVGLIRHGRGHNIATSFRPRVGT